MDDNPERLDALNLLCGSEIGRGMTRHVFECRLRPELVVKVERGDRSHFQNILEWHVWSRVAGTAYEQWFAPVEHLSHEGRLLLMWKTEPLRADELPKKMPAFFTDLKARNFGVLQGRVVCHDYGSTLLNEVGMTKRMQTVTSWRMTG